MDSFLKLAFDELLRKFDEIEAQWEQRLSRTMSALERRGAGVELRISGLEQSGTTQLIVANNWGGLFDEIPALSYQPVTEPDAASSDSDASSTDFVVPARVTPAPTASSAASTFIKANALETSPAEYQRQIQELEQPPASSFRAAAEEEEALHSILFSGYVGSLGAEFAQAVEKKQVAQQEAEHSGFLVAQVKQERHVAVVRAEALGASGRVFVGVNLEPRGSPQLLVAAAAAGNSEIHAVTVSDILSVHPGQIHCLRLACCYMDEHQAGPLFHLGPDENALRAALLGGYDGSLDDDLATSFDHLDAPLDRAVGRVDQALAADAALRADAVGAVGGGQLAWVAAAGSVLTLARPPPLVRYGLAPLNDVKVPSVAPALAGTVMGKDYSHRITRYADAAVLAELIFVHNAHVEGHLCYLLWFDPFPMASRWADIDEQRFGRIPRSPANVEDQFGSSILFPYTSIDVINPSSTSIDAQVVFDEIQQRYITNLTSASWMGVALSGSSATKADDEQKVFVEMSAQNTGLLVFFQYISNCRWPSTAHTYEILMIDFTWEEARVLPLPPLKIWHNFSGVLSIDSDYNSSVVPSSKVPLAWDPGDLEQIIYSWSLFFAHFGGSLVIRPEFFKISCNQCTCKCSAIPCLFCWNYGQIRLLGGMTNVAVVLWPQTFMLLPQQRDDGFFTVSNGQTDLPVTYLMHTSCCIELQPWPPPAILQTNISSELVVTISVGRKLSVLDHVTCAASDLIVFGYDELQLG